MCFSVSNLDVTFKVSRRTVTGEHRHWNTFDTPTREQ